MRELARLAALLLAAVVVARDVAVVGVTGPVLRLTVLVALLVVAALVSRWDGYVTASGVALAGHYLVSLGFGEVEVDLAAPAVAVLLLAYLEMADLAVALPGDRRVDRAFVRATLLRTVRTSGVALLAGVAVFAVALVPWPASEAFRALGVLGAVSVVAVPVILLRRPQ